MVYMGGAVTCVFSGHGRGGSMVGVTFHSSRCGAGSGMLSAIMGVLMGMFLCPGIGFRWHAVFVVIMDRLYSAFQRRIEHTRLPAGFGGFMVVG